MRDGVDIEYATEEVTLSDIKESFDNFLRGCGYIVPYEDELDNCCCEMNDCDTPCESLSDFELIQENEK